MESGKKIRGILFYTLGIVKTICGLIFAVTLIRIHERKMPRKIALIKEGEKRKRRKRNIFQFSSTVSTIQFSVYSF